MHRKIISLMAGFFIVVLGWPNVAHSQGKSSVDFGNPKDTIVAIEQATILKTHVLEDLNRQRTASNLQPYATFEEYLDLFIAAEIARLIKGASSFRAVKACEHWRGLTQIKKDVIKTDLGGNPPCAE